MTTTAPPPRRLPGLAPRCPCPERAQRFRVLLCRAHPDCQRRWTVRDPQRLRLALRARELHEQPAELQPPI